jgi:hypothetical protein
VLRNGGTLYVDRGRPAPGLIDTTLRNLADVGPNLWFNVPRGFDQAAAALARDPDLARAVFRELRMVLLRRRGAGAEHPDPARGRSPPPPGSASLTARRAAPGRASRSRSAA